LITEAKYAGSAADALIAVNCHAADVGHLRGRKLTAIKVALACTHIMLIGLDFARESCACLQCSRIQGVQQRAPPSAQSARSRGLQHAARNSSRERIVCGLPDGRHAS
jgi:hypothetical protein